jgi:hypothetical protein
MTQPAYIAASGGDDAPAINAALASAGSVELGTDTYRIASTVVVPQNSALRGQGWGTKIQKIANIDMMDMRYGATVEHVCINGDGANFSGRGIVVKADQHYQRLTSVSVSSRDYCVHFEATDAGGHMKIDDAFITRSELTSFAIKLPDTDTTSGGNRIFRDIRCGGGYGIDLGGANNTMVDRINASQIQMNPSLRTLNLVNSRIGGTVQFHGRQIWMAFNNVSNGIWIHGDVYDSLFIASHSNNPITRTDPAGNGNKVW